MILNDQFGSRFGTVVLLEGSFKLLIEQYIRFGGLIRKLFQMIGPASTSY